MLWIIISAVIVLIVSSWLGFRKVLYLDQISTRMVLISGIIALAILFLLELLFNNGLLPEPLAAGLMSGLYSSISGVFMGAGIRQYLEKNKLRKIEYVHRSFLSDTLPNLIALTLIIAGIARTSILNDLSITPIRMSSGLSLISIGFFAMTLRLIPEFRELGIVILDRCIDWDNFVSYRWHGEYVIEIDFEYNGYIKTYRTIIPVEDHIKMEELLARKMIEKLEDKES